MTRKKLAAFGCSLVAVLLLATLGSFVMQSHSLPATEPNSLSELENYPGTVQLRDLNQYEIQTEITQLSLYGNLMGIPLQGYQDMRNKLNSKGYTFSDTPTHVYIAEVQSLTTPEGETYHGAVYMQWSNMGGNGTKALLAGGVMNGGTPITQTSIILGTVTNVLPPEEMPTMDPYIIWNAEPYFFFQFFWWHPWWDTPYWRIAYWRYWWYDSHKAPNWFWGPYWWWRTNVRYYPTLTVYYPWYWWWWNWYYWRGWSWWSTYWNL